MTGRTLPLTGCVVCILSLAIQTFLVQTVTLRPGSAPLPGSTPLIPIARQASAAWDVDGRLAQGADPAFTSALLSAVFGPSSPQNYTIPTNCVTGNCTWPLYQTLSVCSRCEDMSSSVIANPDGTHTVPNGFGIYDASTVFKVKTTVQYSPDDLRGSVGPPLPSSLMPSIAFKDQGSIMADILFMYSPNSGEADADHFFAYECLLQYCVKTYNATEVNGVLTERSVPTTYIDNSPSAQANLLTGSADVDIYDLKPPNAQDDGGVPTTQGYSVPGLSYPVDMMAQQLTSLLFATTFQGTAGLTPSVGNKPEGTTPAVDYIYSQLDQASDRLGYLNTLAGNIASSLSRKMRMYNWVGGGTSLGSRIEVPGIAHESSIIVGVQWAWLTLPALNLLVALGFLVAVIWTTEKKHAYAWKNSALAPLVLGLESEQEKVDSQTHLGELQDIKKGVGSKRARIDRRDVQLKFA